MNEIQTIQSKIYEIRGQRVMLDSDLAAMYGVETRALNQAVKRNIERFPEDFMFQLTKGEFEILKSQIAISKFEDLSTDSNLTSQIVISRFLDKTNPQSNTVWGGNRRQPYAFTEQGVAMLSSVLRFKSTSASSVHSLNSAAWPRHWCFPILLPMSLSYARTLKT